MYGIELLGDLYILYIDEIIFKLSLISRKLEYLQTNLQKAFW